MNLLEFLRAKPIEGSRPVVLYQGVQLSRGEMFERAGQLARGLQARGLQPGDRVGLAMANPAIFLTSLLGLAQAGAIGVAVKSAWLAQPQQSPLPILGLSWLAHDQRELASTSLPASLPILRARDVFSDAPLASAAPVAQPQAQSSTQDRPWLFAQSSGTTGQPKTVVVSQAAMQASMVLGEQFQPEDRVMLFVDITIYFAMASALRVLLAGGMVVPQAPNIPPVQLLQAIRDTQANVLVLSSDAASKLASYLLDFPDPQNDLRLSRVIIGGGRVSAEVIDALRTHWGASVVVYYGATEMGPMAVWRQGSDLAQETDYLLTPYEGVQLEVVDALGGPVGKGEVGFLRLRSAAMFSGYLDDNGQLPTHAPPWFYPGDLASLTWEGLLQLLGRADHVLNLGGRKVNPESIEQVLCSHPQVADAAVTIAAMGQAQVQVLVALLVGKPGADLSGAPAHCAQGLPPAQRPEYFLTVPVLPRNAMGKLQRQQLAQRVRMARG